MKLETALSALQASTRHSIFTLPKIIGTHAASVYRYRDQGKGLSRTRALNLLDKKDDRFLRAWVESGLFWDPIRSIEKDKPQEMFDVNIPGLQNFIGNGMVMHNSGSLEQDADVILFIYRQAVYWQQQKPRRRSNETEAKFNQRYAEWSDEMAKIANLAEIILEKNRQGQAGVSVDVHWSGPKTTFSDLARQDSLPGHQINPND